MTNSVAVWQLGILQSFYTYCFKEQLILLPTDSALSPFPKIRFILLHCISGTNKSAKVAMEAAYFFFFFQLFIGLKIGFSFYKTFSFYSAWGGKKAFCFPTWQQDHTKKKKEESFWKASHKRRRHIIKTRSRKKYMTVESSFWWKMNQEPGPTTQSMELMFHWKRIPFGGETWFSNCQR